MLIPYNVDRVTRRVPYFTYGLIGLNVFIFLTTIFISNIRLEADKIVGIREARALLAEDKSFTPPTMNFEELEEESSDEESNSTDGGDSSSRTVPHLTLPDFTQRGQGLTMRGQTPGVTGAPSATGAPAATGAPSSTATETKEDKIDIFSQMHALKMAFDKADDAPGYERFWRIQHLNDRVVFDPHYSVLNVFAYRASEKGFLDKIIGLLGSMFLHGGFEHLLGNMLFLWVYGRALEDTLGPLIYLGAYLLAGIAATLMYHVITMQFTPHSAGIPLMGASGAIAGVMGLFAVRFYRTPVRMFYILPTTIPIFVIASLIASVGWYMVVRESLTSGLLGVASAAAFIFFYGRTWAWGNFMAPSAMIIGGWILISNVIPGVRKLFETEKSGGVAYWAHIGGFAFGMVYALLIGSQAEGGKEYMLEDAQKAYDGADMNKAVERAQNLLVREPNNAGAYEVLAKAYDRLGNEEAALDNFELATDQYLQKGERDAAVTVYLAALHKHERFILPPDKQLAIGNQMAKNSDFQNAAETLVKIPYTFPDAPESEISLLRSAQLYLEHLGQPQMTMQLLEYFVHRYPQSQWMPQVERAYRVAQYQVAGPQEQPQEASFTAPEPEVPRQRPQAVLSSDFLPPKR